MRWVNRKIPRMSNAPANTEPIIDYRAGTERADFQFGSLAVHDFTNSTGVQQIRTPECSIFLLNTGVTVTDIWEGERQRQHSYTAGDLIFLPANTDVHASYVSNTYSETMVRLPCATLLAVADGLVDPALVDIRYVALDSSRNFGLTAAVSTIARSDVQSPAMPLLVESLTTALAAGILCALSPVTRATVRAMRPGLTDRRRRLAIDFIEANLHRAITLADIAAAAHMSLYHFTRSFKAAMGVTPVRYLWARRIELARRLLRDPALQLVDVSLACGFASQSHFTTAFKMATGMTPAAWRRSRN